MPKKWGSVARRGGRVVKGEDWREPAEGQERPGPTTARTPEPPPRPAARAPASRRDEQPREPSRSRNRLPPEVVREIQRAGGRRGNLLAERLGHATEAYARDRYAESRTLLRALSRDLPDLASVRELHGLVLYRMEKWGAAIKELEVAAELSHSVDQHPVIADCYRALGRHAKVAETWETLRQGGASVEVLAEGRLVRAGDLADQGQLREAIEMLESAGGRDLRRPRLDHLRQWYAIGDLYERAGELPKAKTYFLRVGFHDPEHADVAQRLKALR